MVTKKWLSAGIVLAALGGRHTRGTAVDVTLITKDGCELAMPTAFDPLRGKPHPSGRGQERGRLAAF